MLTLAGWRMVPDNSASELIQWATAFGVSVSNWVSVVELSSIRSPTIQKRLDVRGAADECPPKDEGRSGCKWQELDLAVRHLHTRCDGSRLLESPAMGHLSSRLHRRRRVHVVALGHRGSCAVGCQSNCLAQPTQAVSSGAACLRLGLSIGLLWRCEQKTTLLPIGWIGTHHPGTGAAE